jgi:DNA-binding response OmpR family regulator
MKRAQLQLREIIEIWDISIDISRHTVSQNSTPIKISHKEYLIIEYLAINNGFFKTKTQIIDHVWGEAEANLNMDSTTLEAHISHIRNKLWKDIIIMERWNGYKIA